jgi:hypothetical protein
VEIDWYAGPHAQLRRLFELAEDSHSRLDRYIDLGRILLARRGARILGHLRLVPRVSSQDIKLKNMAVMPRERGSGLSRPLVEAAIR